MRALHAHDTRSAFQTGPLDATASLEGELDMDPANAMRSAGRGMNVTDIVRKEGVVEGLHGHPASPPLAVSQPLHLRHLARHRHREPGSGKLEDEQRSYLGRTLCFAKPAEARLRISISIA